jgi:hypothetical protein
MSATPQSPDAPLPDHREKPVKRSRPRLSGSTVAEIRKLYHEAQRNGENLGYGQLARMFQTGRSTIRDICRNKTHVENKLEPTPVSSATRTNEQDGS